VLGVSLRCSAGGCGLHRLVAEAIAGTPGSCSHGALGRPRAEQRGMCVRVRVYVCVCVCVWGRARGVLQYW